jgi:hypothetical protein
MFINGVKPLLGYSILVMDATSGHGFVPLPVGSASRKEWKIFINGVKSLLGHSIPVMDSTSDHGLIPWSLHQFGGSPISWQCHPEGVENICQWCEAAVGLLHPCHGFSVGSWVHTFPTMPAVGKDEVLVEHRYRHQKH